MQEDDPMHLPESFKKRFFKIQRQQSCAALGISALVIHQWQLRSITESDLPYKLKCVLASGQSFTFSHLMCSLQSGCVMMTGI